MAYSRWWNSQWYTYWTSSYSPSCKFKLPTRGLKDGQTFEICDWDNSIQIRYWDLRHFGIDSMVEVVKHRYKEYDYTEEDYEELKGYIQEFVNDVDDHFKLWNFFKYEWYYPVRNRIYRAFKRDH
jgi:hypothetical protein